MVQTFLCTLGNVYLDFHNQSCSVHIGNGLKDQATSTLG